MVALSFKAQFHDDIHTKRKTHTLRDRGRRHMPVRGTLLQIYTAMRTKQCKKWGDAVCTGTLDLTIDFDQRRVEFASGHAITTADDTDAFAVRDGFPGGWRDMEAFWKKNHPGVRIWEGVMIQWGETFTPARPEPA